MILLGPEITLNGGFEAHASEAQSWSVPGAGVTSFYVVSSYPFAGENHAYFKAFTVPAVEYVIRNGPLTIMVTSGEDYRIGAAISPETGSLMVAQVANNSYSTFIGLNETFTPETTVIPSWHYYTWDFGCTESTYPILELGFSSTPVQRASLFDAVSFRRKIEISVGYDYKNGQVLDRILARSAGGNLRTYTGLGSYRKFKVPVSWVSSKDASAINSWWQTGTEIRFIENDDFPNSFYNVRIVGNSQPLNQYQQVYFGYFLGVLDMETV